MFRVCKFRAGLTATLSSSLCLGLYSFGGSQPVLFPHLMSLFVCQVCFEETSERLPLPRFATGNGDVFRSMDCEHPICKTCMGTYVATRVSEQRVFNVRCPYEGCRNELYEKDVCKLAEAGALPEETCRRYFELRARDFSVRAQTFTEVQPRTEADVDFLMMMHDNTRLCPKCNLVIERSEGCNSFYCLCGAHFNYASATRPVGNGVKRFGKKVRMAQMFSLPFEQAEQFNGDFKAFARASKTALQLGLPLEEAMRLNRSAAEGDEQARARIQNARLSQTVAVSSAEADASEWQECGDLFAISEITASQSGPATVERASCEGWSISLGAVTRAVGCRRRLCGRRG